MEAVVNSSCVEKPIESSKEIFSFRVYANVNRGRTNWNQLTNLHWFLTPDKVLTVVRLISVSFSAPYPSAFVLPPPLWKNWYEGPKYCDYEHDCDEITRDFHLIRHASPKPNVLVANSHFLLGRNYLHHRRTEEETWDKWFWFECPSLSAGWISSLRFLDHQHYNGEADNLLTGRLSDERWSGSCKRSNG